MKAPFWRADNWCAKRLGVYHGWFFLPPLCLGISQRKCLLERLTLRVVLGASAARTRGEGPASAFQRPAGPLRRKRSHVKLLWVKLLWVAYLKQVRLLWGLPRGASKRLGDQSSAGGTTWARRRFTLLWRTSIVLPDGPFEL